MSDKRYHNIYYSYEARTTESSVQLENNITKALINTLEHTSPGVTAKFFKQVVSLPVTVQLMQEDVEFALQTRDLNVLGNIFTTEILLGLVPEKYKEKSIEVVEKVFNSTSDEPLEQESIPDAWMWKDNDFLVLIESKVADSLDENQMFAQKGLLNDVCRYELRTWKEIVEFFIEIKKTLESKVSLSDQQILDHFLITQFIEYLELNTLTPFIGFKPEDFDRAYDKEMNGRNTTKEKIERFIKTVQDELPIELRNELKGRHVGSLIEPHFWGVLYNPDSLPSSRKDKHIDVPHFTFSLHSLGFYVGINFEAKNVVCNFYNKINENTTKFRKLITTASKENKINLKIMFRKHIRAHVFEDHPSVEYVFSPETKLFNEDIGAIFKRLRLIGKEKPNSDAKYYYRIFLCRFYNRTEPKLASKDFIKTAIDDIRLLWPFYRFAT